MTRQLDQQHEDRVIARNKLLVRALEFELVDSLSHADITLLGFSVKLDPDRVLITLRAFFDDLHQVTFVKSDTIPQCIVKCVKMANQDRLKWKEDSWAND